MENENFDFDDFSEAFERTFDRHQNFTILTKLVLQVCISGAISKFECRKCHQKVPLRSVQEDTALLTLIKHTRKKLHNQTYSTRWRDSEALPFSSGLRNYS